MYKVPGTNIDKNPTMKIMNLMPLLKYDRGYGTIQKNAIIGQKGQKYCRETSILAGNASSMPIYCKDQANSSRSQK